jgi:hypothetical protein
MFYNRLHVLIVIAGLSVPLYAMNICQLHAPCNPLQLRFPLFTQNDFKQLKALEQQLLKIKPKIEQYKNHHNEIPLRQEQRSLEKELGTLRNKRVTDCWKRLDIQDGAIEYFETLMQRRLIMPLIKKQGENAGVNYDIWYIVCSFLYGGASSSSRATVYSSLAATFFSRNIPMVRGLGNRTTAFALSYDGTELLIGKANGTVYHFNLQNGCQTDYDFMIQVSRRPITNLFWTRNGRWFGSSKDREGIYFQGGHNQEAYIEQSALSRALAANPQLEGEALQHLMRRNHSPAIYARCGNGSHEFIVDQKGTLKIRTHQGVVHRPHLRDEIDPDTGMRYPEEIENFFDSSDDGKAWIFGNKSGTKFWIGRELTPQGQGLQGRIAESIITASTPSTLPVYACIDQQGTYCATLRDGDVQVLKCSEHEQNLVVESLLKLDRDERHVFHSVAISPHGSRLYTCSQQGIIGVYERSTGACLTMVHPQQMQSCRINPQLQRSYVAEIHTGIQLSKNAEKLMTYNLQGEGYAVCVYDLLLLESCHFEKINPRVTHTALGLLAAKRMVQKARGVNPQRITALVCNVPSEDYRAMEDMDEQGGINKQMMSNFGTHIDDLLLTSMPVTQTDRGIPTILRSTPTILRSTKKRKRRTTLPAHELITNSSSSSSSSTSLSSSMSNGFPRTNSR